jgi:hypothetical protein
VFNRAELIAAMAQSGYRQVFTVEHDLAVTYKGVIGPRVFRSIVFQS